MTALDGYARLEAPGIWRGHPHDQRRDVTVTLGKATLSILDRADVALAHWSLAAVVRRNPGRTPAAYTPGEDASEELEIDDETMIDAIETVRRAIERRRPREGRLRFGLALALTAGVALAGVLWLPDLLVRHTASVVPAALRTAIGDRLLFEISRVSGAPCDDLAGRLALSTLTRRLLGPGGGPLVVLPDGIERSASLPGGTILLARGLVEDHEGPEPLAGFVLAEAQHAAQDDPMARLLRHSGTVATVGLLTRGTLAQRRLTDYARSISAQAAPPVDTAALLARFEAARVPSTPYARALDFSGEDVLPLIEGDPVPEDAALPIIPDGRWVALQGICGG